MAARRSKRKSKYGKREGIGAGGWFGIAIGILGVSLVTGLMATAYIKKPIALDPDTLCQIDTEITGSLAILIDNTDKIPDRSSRQAQVYLAKQIDSLPDNTLVSVFVMSTDSASHITPLISRCRPNNGEAASQMTQNPELIKRRFETEFYTPLIETLNELFDKEPASYSPILESLQSITIEAFQPFSKNVDRRLIVISDLLQHSSNYSMYSQPPDYDEFKARAETIGQNSLNLQGVEVEFLVLPRETPAGTRADIVKFWQTLIAEKGATLGSSMIPM